MSAEVTLDYYTMPVVHAITRVHWQPPDVKFEHVPSQLGPRGQYHIAPYREPDSSSYNRFPDDVVYTVTRSTSMINGISSANYSVHRHRILQRHPRRLFKPVSSQSFQKTCASSVFRDMSSRLRL